MRQKGGQLKEGKAEFLFRKFVFAEHEDCFSINSVRPLDPAESSHDGRRGPLVPLLSHQRPQHFFHCVDGHVLPEGAAHRSGVVLFCHRLSEIAICYVSIEEFFKIYYFFTAGAASASKDTASTKRRKKKEKNLIVAQSLTFPE